MPALKILGCWVIEEERGYLMVQEDNRLIEIHYSPTELNLLDRQQFDEWCGEKAKAIKKKFKKSSV